MIERGIIERVAREVYISFDSLEDCYFIVCSYEMRKKMLEKIIQTSQYVIANAKHVKIQEKKVEEFAKSINPIQSQHLLWTSPFGILELPTKQIVNFLLIYEAIDFSFWGEPKWNIETEEGKLDGSIALLYALLKVVKERQNTDFSKITRQRISNNLKGKCRNPTTRRKTSNYKRCKSYYK